MKDEKPKFLDHELFRLLRQEKVEEFNARRAKGEECAFLNVDLSGTNLQGTDINGLDFSGSYFRGADLRGLNLSRCRLEGTSIYGAHISGTYFPEELSANEIHLSLTHGTRMRYSS